MIGSGCRLFGASRMKAAKGGSIIGFLGFRGSGFRVLGF